MRWQFDQPLGRDPASAPHCTFIHIPKAEWLTNLGTGGRWGEDICDLLFELEGMRGNP